MKRIDAPAPPGVSLARDENGVVHVETAGPDDLEGACWAMGFAHALDRGMQISLMRILVQGRGSECLESTDAMLDVDRFFRRMNWYGNATQELARLDERHRALLSRYCEGINSRLPGHRPWELALVGYHIEPWAPADVIAFSRMIGYLTLAQSQAEIERLIVQMARAGVSDEMLFELFPPLASSGWDRSLIEKVTLGERMVPDSIRWLSPAPRMMASNSWVVGPSRSASGNALFANDPHLETNRLPNVWYEMVLDLGPGRWAAGAGMPGVPGILVGRTQDLAWGATYTFMDAVDSWVEDVEDGRYRRGDSWVAFDVREETILRKGKAPVRLVVHENLHGVLDGDPAVKGHYLATRWAPGASGARSVASMIGMLEASDVEQGMELLGRLEVSFSWVLADVGGHIGMQMSGLMPRRKRGNGLAPLPGWDPDSDWQGFVDPGELPRCIDPPEGFIVTANQDLNHLGLVSPIDMPMGDYRARRIEQVLGSTREMDVARMGALQMDTRSLQADRFLEVLAPLLPDTERGRMLGQWDRCYDTGSRGAALFEDFYEELRKGVFGASGLGDEVVGYLASETGTFVDFYKSFDDVLLSPSSAWFAGRSREELWREALSRAESRPAVTWGERNRITLTNIFFGGKMPRLLGFDHGPIPLPGGRATVHQGQVYRSAGRVTSFAPSLRVLADMGEPWLSTCMAGGPSDRRFGNLYVSDLERWKNGGSKKLAAGDHHKKR